MILSLLLLLLGLTSTLGTRTTLVQFQTQSVDSPFLVEYVYLSDCILALTLIYLLVRKAIPRNIVIITSSITTGAALLSLDDPYPILGYLATVRLGIIALVISSVVRLGQFRWLLWGFVAGIVFQIGIATTQMIRQSSIGLQLLGESVFNSTLAGRAKIELWGRILVRVPGLYPHPNVFAGAVLVASLGVFQSYAPKIIPWIIVATLFLLMKIDHYLISYVQGIWIAGTAIGLTLNPPAITIPKSAIVPLFALINGILFLTGSKSVLGLAILIQLTFLTIWAGRKMFHVEHFQKPWTWMSFPITTFTFLGLVLGAPWVIELTTIQNRIFFVNQTLSILSTQWLFGVGLSQFVAALPPGLPLWRYEPVHNIPLLITAELGVIGLLAWISLILLWCYTLIKQSHATSK